MAAKVNKKSKAHRHDPLGQQILADDAPRVRRRVTAPLVVEEEAGAKFVDARLSQKILLQARAQQAEEAATSAEGRQAVATAKHAHALSRARKGGFGGTGAEDSGDDGDEDQLDEEDASEFAADDVIVAGREEDGEELYHHLQISADDERVLAQFMPNSQPKRHTLADAIMGRIHDAKTEIASQHSHAPEQPDLDPKVVAVFGSVGQILATYRAGKLPKAFKIIPTLRNWEDVLFLTEPDGWSAASMYQATRIFASNLNAKMAQRFFNLVLLPRVRDDIAEYKRLNFHLYMAMKKALFKPAAFFKGILLPLCEAGDCTLREAVIISSVLARTSIPVLHSSAAMLKIAELPYTGANSIFLRMLLDKKYALPFRVVDALVFHFVRFTNDFRELPVLWHQSLLVFVQRYKEDITSEQKEALLALLRAHSHGAITPDVRHELVHSRCRACATDAAPDINVIVGRSRDNEVPLEASEAMDVDS